MMTTYLDTAKGAAMAAGKILMKKFGKDVNAKRKTDRSFVSDADLAAEKEIINRISKRFPEHSFFAEESGRSMESGSEYCWYIDPLDGTHNFIHNIPYFGVSIALAKRKKFIVGVIHLPFTGELFYAEKGKGAWLNGKRIRVSGKKLHESVFTAPTSFVHYGDSVIFKILKTMRKHIPEVRMIGSCAVNLAYIACGRFDIYVKPSITPYDTGAGVVILEEAGGKLTKFNGEEFDAESWNFIASNNKDHKKLISIFKGSSVRKDENTRMRR